MSKITIIQVGRGIVLGQLKGKVDIEAVPLLQGQSQATPGSATSPLDLIEQTIGHVNAAGLVLDLTGIQLTTVEQNAAAPSVSALALSVSELLEILTKSSSGTSQWSRVSSVIVSPAVRDAIIAAEPTMPSSLARKLIGYRLDSTEREASDRYRDHSYVRGPQSTAGLINDIQRSRAPHLLPDTDRANWARSRRQTFLSLQQASNNTVWTDSFDVGDLKGHFRSSYQGFDRRLLTIWLNGAVDPTRAQGRPVFQRQSWWKMIRGTHVSIPDPTLAVHAELALAWGFGTRDTWAIPVQAGIAQGAIDAWLERSSIRREDAHIRIFGSSAGGFQALAIGALTDVDEVIAVNPQTDFLPYERPEHVTRLLSAVSGGELTKSTVREDYPLRHSVLRFWQAINYSPREVKYLVNTASAADMTIHLPRFLEYQSEIKNARGASNSAVHWYFSGEDGHNPLLPEEVFDLLDRHSSLHGPTHH